MGPKKSCSVWQKLIPDRCFMTCKDYKNKYDLQCANVTIIRFHNLMEPEDKLYWVCRKCRNSQPHKYNVTKSNIPTRSTTTCTINTRQRTKISQAVLERSISDELLEDQNSSTNGDTFSPQFSDCYHTIGIVATVLLFSTSSYTSWN